VKADRPGIDGAVRRVAVWINIIVVGLVIATVALVAWPRIADALGGPAASASGRAPAYTAGDTIDVPGGWYDQSSHTLVLFAQSRCGACLRAQDFLANLVATVDGRAAVVLAGPNGRHEAELRYASSLGITNASVFETPPGLRARVTPTLVLVDRTGTVLGAWEGVPPERQAAITQTIVSAVATTPPVDP
jgi:hypothetical protein